MDHRGQGATHRTVQFDDALTTPSLLERRAERHPDKTFATFPAGRLSYGDTFERAREVARGLTACGVRPRDRVSAWLPNGPEAVLALFGTNMLGATLAPINIDYRGMILQHVLNLAQAQVLIAHNALIERLIGLDLPHLRLIVGVGTGEAPDIPGTRFLAWPELRSHRSSEPITRASVSPRDDMIIIYTSGTTGPSKGVRCSYVHHAAYAKFFRVGDLSGDDRALVSLPLFHVGGTAWLYSMLSWGGSVALPPRFRTDRFWTDVRELGATTGTVLAAMAGFLLAREPAAGDADNPLRIALMNPTHPNWREFSGRFGVELWSGFGMSEVPGFLQTPLSYPRLESLGHVVSPDWQVRLVDDDDIEVGDGLPGEAIVRHEVPWTITHGYLGMPEATAAAWQNGWFHTGDILRREKNGDYFFVDRKKDALRRRGENVSSFEVEAELLSHPDVVEAAAVAVESHDSEDEILAFVVLRPGATLGHGDLFRHLMPRMAHFMVPRYIEFLEEMPRTPTQKIQKVELRKRGIGAATWDREAEGFTIKSTRLT
jgi:crotonobetaine/carnitine-CoA ligase